MADAAPAAEARPNPKPNMLGMLLQVAAVYLLWQNFSSKKKAPVDPQAAAAALLETLATPTPSASGGPAGGVAAPDVFSLLGMPDPRKSTRKVLPELAYREAERTGRLAGVPKDSRLRNVWPPGAEFELFVFLSTSAAPIADFAAVDDVLAQWAAGARHSVLATAAWNAGHEGVTVTEAGAAPAGGGAGSPAPAFSLLGGFFKRQLDRLASGGRVTTLPNATVTGLAAPGGGGGAAAAGGREGSAAEAEASSLDLAAAAANATAASGDCGGGAALVWAQRGLTYDWALGTLRQSLNVTLPPCVLRNASHVYAHVFAVAGGSHPDARSPRFQGASSVLSNVYPLITLLRRKPRKETFSLLDNVGASDIKPTPRAATATAAAEVDPEAGAGAGADAGAAAVAASNETRWLPYWRPALPIALLVDHTVHASASLPPPLDSVMDVVADPATARMAGGGTAYVPPLLVDDFWTLAAHLVEVNATSDPVVPLTITYAPASLWKWAMATQMTAQWSMQEQMGAAGEGEADVLKSILLDTNPILLAVTLLVSLLHMVFEFLAFRNDVSFWRGVKTTAGLSVRSIGMSFVTQLIILLYLADNDTSWMVLFSSGIGLLIEGWKLQKALVVNVKWLRLGGWLVVPWVDVSDKEVDAATTQTRQYDDIATRHMLMVLAPLVLGQAGYSLVYDTHKSWYSWLIGSLTSSVYLFGFAQMTPQLYINYRLKSVAAMPWKTMSYKFLNTIIDDIFSFIVKMPTLHRLACFRDDIIFVIYLLQRWLYPVDKARKNEFGASAHDYENAEARRKGLARVVRRGKTERREGPSGEASAAPATMRSATTAVT